MSDDPHYEPGRYEVRCDHGDGKGWGHPAFGVEPWAHACCGVVGHCPSGDPRNFDELPHGAVGDWLIETINGTRVYLVNFPGEDGHHWWRVPGSAKSSQAYSDRPYRLAALHGRPGDGPTQGNRPVRVGHPFTIGTAYPSDPWHASRVVSIRRLDGMEVIAAFQDVAGLDD